MVVSIFFYVHPYLGKISILTNMFQMGWFNQQLVLETLFPIGFLFKGTHLGFFLCEVGKLVVVVWSCHGNVEMILKIPYVCNIWFELLRRRHEDLYFSFAF